MQYTLDASQCQNLSVSMSHEWLLTNGIGGYAMGTPCGANTRRYHGLLIAPTDPPVGRLRLVANIETFATVDGITVGLSTNQYPGAIYPDGYLSLSKFQVDGYAEWVYRLHQGTLTKRVGMHPGRNVTTVEWLYDGDHELLLQLRPLVGHRGHHEECSHDTSYPHSLAYDEEQTTLTHRDQSLVIYHSGASALPLNTWYYQMEYARERDRGLKATEDLFAPVELRYTLLPGDSCQIHLGLGNSLPDPNFEFKTHGKVHGLKDALSRSARHFAVKTERRTSIIAGYPWFTDWGRDTMISLPGILLAAGRVVEARQLLRDYASSIEKGMIPNRFVEESEKADYNTADATLWFVNAAYKTLLADWDDKFAAEMLTAFELIFEGHVGGTRFGIQVDPEDGLLRQGGPDTQLTWMDAKIGDWVVTSRHGKAIEIVALWMNAVRIMEWLREKCSGNNWRHSVEDYRFWAELAERHFDEKFWRPALGFYADTIEPEDTRLRPNQVIAMGLPFVQFDPEHAKQALAIVEKHLATPVGLRTLGPEEEGYRGKYEGPMRELDSAYHMGTVWPWLLGSYLSASTRYLNDHTETKRTIRSLKSAIEEYGLGGIAEVYDGDPPHRPNGCPWQAWSVSEILRFLHESGGA